MTPVLRHERDPTGDAAFQGGTLISSEDAAELFEEHLCVLAVMANHLGHTSQADNGSTTMQSADNTAAPAGTHFFHGHKTVARSRCTAG